MRIPDQTLRLLQWTLGLLACAWPALLMYHLWAAGIFARSGPYHDTYYVVFHFGPGTLISFAAAALALAIFVWRRTSSQGT